MAGWNKKPRRVAGAIREEWRFGKSVGADYGSCCASTLLPSKIHLSAGKSRVSGSVKAGFREGFSQRLQARTVQSCDKKSLHGYRLRGPGLPLCFEQQQWGS